MRPVPDSSTLCVKEGGTWQKRHGGLRCSREKNVKSHSRNEDRDQHNMEECRSTFEQ